MASPTARAVPSTRATPEAKMESTPKASSGSVVTKPSAAFDSPVSARMSATSGPTLASAGRRLRATSAMPTTSSHWREPVAACAARVCTTGRGDLSGVT